MTFKLVDFYMIVQQIVTSTNMVAVSGFGCGRERNESTVRATASFLAVAVPFYYL